jgi:hypothetical protein
MRRADGVRPEMLYELWRTARTTALLSSCFVALRSPSTVVAVEVLRGVSSRQNGSSRRPPSLASFARRRRLSLMIESLFGLKDFTRAPIGGAAKVGPRACLLLLVCRLAHDKRGSRAADLLLAGFALKSDEGRVCVNHCTWPRLYCSLRLSRRPPFGLEAPVADLSFSLGASQFTNGS